MSVEDEREAVERDENGDPRRGVNDHTTPVGEESTRVIAQVGERLGEYERWGAYEQEEWDQEDEIDDGLTYAQEAHVVGVAREAAENVDGDEIGGYTDGRRYDQEIIGYVIAETIQIGSVF